MELKDLFYSWHSSNKIFFLADHRTTTFQNYCEVAVYRQTLLQRWWFYNTTDAFNAHIHTHMYKNKQHYTEINMLSK